MSVAEYIAALDQEFSKGDATEHTHRPALKALLEAFGAKIQATNEPKKIAGNAPDYVVRRNAAILGHVEAKDIGTDLAKALETPQLVRYREALPNLVLTDYLEFVWLRQGQEEIRVRLGQVSGNRITAAANADAEWAKLTQAFFNEVAPTLSSPKQLAQILAAQTRLLRELILEVISAGTDKELIQQREAFSKMLVPNLSEEDFADMFAQTVAYGLFTARVFDKTLQDFSLHEAEKLIPKATPFLRRFFHYVASPDLTEGVQWMVEQIVAILSHCDLSKILYRQSRRLGFEDPVFHFYETFLSEYDATLREARGVYYTPAPVVNFIVRGVDELLRTRFHRSEGLSDSATLILDPAAGTATFLRKVIEVIYRQQCDAGLQGAWAAYVRERLLPRIFGFELMMAPYTVAHLKLALELDEYGFQFGDKERLHVYLTNTLERIKNVTSVMFAQWLADESAGAEDVKNNKPVQVVLGNPPYSGHSANKGKWITQLIQDYKKGCPELLKPGQAKWLSDDYVKFIRFAQWRIVQTGHGIVAFIANHAWLDNPTFRGMRRALLRDFDEIYVLDLHGSSKKKERTPANFSDRGDDKNVFDIQQGVAIMFLVRLPEHVDGNGCVVRHAELWGTRANKYAWLDDKKVGDVKWQSLELVEPQIPFKPVETAALAKYRDGWPIPDIFALNGDPAPGMVTTQDDFAISWSADEAIQKVDQLLATSTEVEARALFKLCKQEQWQYDRAKKELKNGEWKKEVTAVLYRPFDTRYTVYNRNVTVHRRERASRHMLQKTNIGLCTTRTVETGQFSHALVADKPITLHAVSMKEINYICPLYLEPDAESGLDTNTAIRRPNLSPKYLQALADRLQVGVDGPFGLPEGVTPEAVFHYIYAVLYARSYRSRYVSFLKSDFPRIPLPPSNEVFDRLSALGQQLVETHLMHMQTGQSPKFPAQGTDQVTEATYQPPDGHAGRVRINKDQYFEGVTPEDWDFAIGGFRVLHQWLKDRKGRKLGHDDIVFYRQIVMAVQRTRDLMDEIDTVFTSSY